MGSGVLTTLAFSPEFSRRLGLSPAQVRRESAFNGGVKQSRFFRYARVFDEDQDLAQDAELVRAGCAKFKEKASGAKTNRPELAKAIRQLEPSDVLGGQALCLLACSTLRHSVNHHAWRVIKRNRNAAEFARRFAFHRAKILVSRFWGETWPGFRGLWRECSMAVKTKDISDRSTTIGLS
jgi:hypothetical protein